MPPIYTIFDRFYNVDITRQEVRDLSEEDLLLVCHALSHDRFFMPVGHCSYNICVIILFKHIRRALRKLCYKNTIRVF